METSLFANEERFKKQAQKAARSIVIFLICYFIIFILSLALAIAIMAGGFFIIASHPSFLTLLLGGGLMVAGALILFFLFKFMFSIKKIDRSDYIEVYRTDQPALFDTIDRVVQGTNSVYPKRVYLTNDVNAMVSYDSSFMSLFVPTKKNLIIGLGLMNSLSTAEFESILAHEFGHFSQDSMKFGSYVYQINRILFDQLYDNDSINRFIQRFNQSGIITLMMVIGVKIIIGIQFLLTKLYEFVNKSYLALSREMEFQADLVAAHYSGKKPFKSALLRTDLASFSYQETLQFFTNRMSQNLVTDDVYELQDYTMKYIASKNKIAVKNGFPDVSLDDINAYQNTKINIENQWASHPSTQDRLENIERIEHQERISNETPAIDLLANKASIVSKITKNLFKHVPYKGALVQVENKQFEKDYANDFERFAIDPYFNNYYRYTDPATRIKKKDAAVSNVESLQDFYSPENIKMAQKYGALVNDLATLESIKPKESGIKFFEYDGKKYTRNQIDALIEKLEAKKEKNEKKVNKHNRFILAYCLQKAEGSALEKSLKKALKQYEDIQEDLISKEQSYLELTEKAEFLSYTLEPEVISDEQIKFRSVEIDWKKYLKQVREEVSFETLLGHYLGQEFDKYLENERPLFNGSHYNDFVVERLVLILHNIPQLLHNRALIQKKQLVEIMKEILES